MPDSAVRRSNEAERETFANEADGINDLAEVVGGSVSANGQYHAFWKSADSLKDQGFVDLGVLSGDNYSVALAINNAGTTVGYSKNTSTGVQRAFVSYNDGSRYDLITKVSNATGWTLQAAEGINTNGWIVGWGTKSSTQRAFVLAPNQ